MIQHLIEKQQKNDLQKKMLSFKIFGNIEAKSKTIIPDCIPQTPSQSSRRYHIVRRSSTSRSYNIK